jgi:hypothetical protein
VQCADDGCADEEATDPVCESQYFLNGALATTYGNMFEEMQPLLNFIGKKMCILRMPVTFLFS